MGAVLVPGPGGRAAAALSAAHRSLAGPTGGAAAALRCPPGGLDAGFANRTQAADSGLDLATAATPANGGGVPVRTLGSLTEPF